jgi:hypothetical protein
MRNFTILGYLMLSASLFCLPVLGDEAIPSGSKVFVAPMGGFETYVQAAFERKSVPLTVIEDREKAEFEISGTAESRPAGLAKKVIMLDWHSTEEASIKVTNIKTNVVVFAYSVHKPSSAHGKQTSAEACAKHLKERVKAK